MDWFNGYGLILIVVIMIPNLLYALKCREGFVNSWKNRAVEALEQIGRFGCFALMIVNIPSTFLGFWFDHALTVYLVVNALLAGVYCAIWAVEFNKDGLFKALALSIIPSVIFLFSGIIVRSVPLILASAIFAPCHILISCKNAAHAKR